MLRGFVCLLVAPLLLIGAPGPDDSLPELRIEIMAIGAGVTPKYSVTLERTRDRRRIESADVAPDGVFRFRDVPYGEYRLTIVDGQGATVYESGIVVNASTATVMLNLPVRTKKGKH